jgi:hypothetical protein
MFATPIPVEKEPLELSDYKTFEEKFLATCEFTKIRNIYFEVSNPQDVDILFPVSLNVTQMGIFGGDATTINSMLKKCYAVLNEEADKLVRGDDDFESIAASLRRCVDQCERGSEQNNINDQFTFDQNLRIQVLKDGEWRQTLFQHLAMTAPIHEDLKEHFNVRKGFFDKMGKSLGKLLVSHQAPPDIQRWPYSLDTSNPELDLSELLYTLYRVTTKLKIDDKAGGTFPKFKRDFFQLFGLSDKDYDKKIIQIRNRKINEHFLNDLASQLTKDHAKFPHVAE